MTFVYDDGYWYCITRSGHRVMLTVKRNPDSIGLTSELIARAEVAQQAIDATNENDE